MTRPNWPGAFIFDLDGVIVRSTPTHILAWSHYLARFGLRLPPQQIERAMLGKHNSDVARAFFGDGLPDHLALLHGREKEKLYRELMAPRLEESLVPGVRQFVQRHSHLPLAVASNAEPENVRFVLEGTSLKRYFRVILTGDDVSRPKPDPEIYLKAATLLGVSPYECVVFEDSQTGIEAARAAGMAVVGLKTTSSELAGAAVLIDDFDDPALEMWLQSYRLAKATGAKPEGTGRSDSAGPASA